MFPKHEDFKIFFWHADDGGSSFYRMKMPQLGLNVLEYKRTYGHVNLFYSCAHSATIVGQRISEDIPSEHWRKMEYVKKKVYDIDDDLFSIDKQYSEGYSFFSKPEIQQNIINNVMISDVVTAASPVLAEQMSRYNKNVHYIPNGLPAEILMWDVPKYKEDKILLGWAGTPSSKLELGLIVEPVKELLRKNNKYEMHCIGLIPDELIVAGLGVKGVMATSWVKGTLNYLKAINFDIWLAPYRNTPFNHAKFPTKALEAAFLGVPIIASDIEPYRNFIKHGETGFLVKRDYEWTRYIKMLTEDQELREKMGRNAKIQATESTIESLMPKWLAAYK